MIMVPKWTYGKQTKTSRKKKTISKKRLSNPKKLLEDSVIFDPEKTLPDDIWKDSFDKFIDCKTPLRQENILKKNVNASFNRDSSIEFSEYAQKLLEQRVNARAKANQKKCSKYKKDCSKRNASNLIISTPNNIKKSKVLDVSCSPIESVRQRIFFPAERKSRPQKTNDCMIAITPTNISQEAVCNKNNSRLRKKMGNQAIVFEQSIEKTSRNKSIEHRKSRRRNKFESSIRSSISANLPVICEDSINSRLSMLSISDKEDERNPPPAPAETNVSHNVEKSVPLFDMDDETTSSYNLVLKDNLDINKLGISKNGTLYKEKALSRRNSIQEHSNNSFPIFSKFGLNIGPISITDESKEINVANISDSIYSPLASVSQKIQDNDIHNLILKNMPKYSTKHQKNALRLKRNNHLKNTYQTTRKESNDENDRKDALSKTSVKKKNTNIMGKPFTDYNPERDHRGKNLKPIEEMNKIAKKSSNSIKLINLRTPSKRIAALKSICVCCVSNRKTSSEDDTRKEPSTTAEEQKITKKTNKIERQPKRKKINIITKKIATSTKNISPNTRSKRELSNESVIYASDARITRRRMKGKPALKEVMKDSEQLSYSDSNEFRYENVAPDNIRAQENKSNSEDSGYRTSPVTIKNTNLHVEGGKSNISSDSNKVQVIITEKDTEMQPTKRQKSVKLRKSEKTRKKNVREKENENQKLIEEKERARKRKPAKQDNTSIANSTKSIDEAQSNFVLRKSSRNIRLRITNYSALINNSHNRKERKNKVGVELERKGSVNKKRGAVTTSKKLKYKELNIKTSKVARMLLYNSLHNVSQSSLICNISCARRKRSTSINAISNSSSKNLNKNVQSDQQIVDRSSYITQRNSKSQNNSEIKRRNRKRGNPLDTTTIEIVNTPENSVNNQINQSVSMPCNLELNEITPTSNKVRKLSRNLLSRKSKMQSKSDHNISNTIGVCNLDDSENIIAVNRASHVIEPDVNKISDKTSKFVTFRNSKSGNLRRTNELKNSKNIHTPLVQPVIIETSLRSNERENQDSIDMHNDEFVTRTKKKRSKNESLEISKHNPVYTDKRNSVEPSKESCIDSTIGDKSKRSFDQHNDANIESANILEQYDQIPRDINISREVLTVIFGNEYVELLDSVNRKTSKFNRSTSDIFIETSDKTNPVLSSPNNQTDNESNFDIAQNIENRIEKAAVNDVANKEDKKTKDNATTICNKILKVRVKRLKLDNIGLKVVTPVDDISLGNHVTNDNIYKDVNDKPTKTIPNKILTVRLKRLNLSDIKKKTVSIANDPFKKPKMIVKQKPNLSNVTALEPIHEEELMSWQTMSNSHEPEADSNTILDESINRSEFLNSIVENTRNFVAKPLKNISWKKSLHGKSSNSLRDSSSIRNDSSSVLEKSKEQSKNKSGGQSLLSDTINETISLRPGKWRRSLSLWKRNQSLIDNSTVSGLNSTTTSSRHQLSINRTLMPVLESEITKLPDNQNSWVSLPSHRQQNQNNSGYDNHQKSILRESTLGNSFNTVNNNDQSVSSVFSNPLLLEPTDDGTPNLPAISLLDNSPVGRKLQQSITSKYIGNNRVITVDCENSKNHSNFDESSNERRHTYQQQLSLSLYRQSLLPARRRRTSVLEGSYQGIVDVLQQGDGDIPFIPSEYVRGQRKSVIRSKLLDKRSIVLRRCGQTEPSDFSTTYSEASLRHCRKIGEGVYGEVFMNKTASGEAIVLKIIPIEGLIEVNGEPQKKFDEILSEIVIAMELSRLRYDKEFMTGGFVDVKKVRCVQGRYPEHLIDLWELYRDNCATENDHPEIFPEDQLYIVLELANGGQDLEAFTFQNALQSNSAFVQTALTLAVAEGKFQFEHRDLHWGNILLSVTDDTEVVFKIKGKEVRIPTYGVKATIIDYTLSRMVFDGYSHFNDLSNDEELFSATGDYQFDIYRFMKERLKNDWQIYEPYTNILWLHYTIDKMISGVRYRCSKNKKHRSAIHDMMQLRDELLDYKSASAYVECLT